MFRIKKQPEQSPCPPLELLVKHVASVEELSRQQRELVVDHIRQCAYCCDIYGVLCDIDQELGQDIRQGSGIPEPEFQPTRTVEEAWAETSRKIDAIEAAERRQRRRAIIFRIGAAAACVLIAIGAGWLTQRPGSPGRHAPTIAANGGGMPAAGFAELVTGPDRKPLAMNQPFATAGQPQEILLGGMHRVVMNRNTKATFSASSVSAASARSDVAHPGKVPYEIQLAKGELYVEVVPGNPFTVRTANARLAITGTKFDVRAEGDKTELTLLKGGVRLSQLAAGGAAGAAKAFVDVTAGHASAVVGRSAPTPPRQADALAATAWARGLALTNAVAAADPEADLAMLDSVRESWPQSKPADLTAIDYVQWRDEHRDWFAREFPWIFKAQKVLKDRHGIDADYIELLMVSGDIWQFHYDPALPADQPLTKLDPLAVTRLARHCGLDEREMLRGAGLPDSTPTAASPAGAPTPGRRYADALRRWHGSLMMAGQQDPHSDHDLMMFSLRAGRHLADARTAAYLWAKNNPEKARQLLADKEYLALLPRPPATTPGRNQGAAENAIPNDNEILDPGEWIEPLRQQAVVARNYVPAAMEWLLVPPGTGCAPHASDKQRKLAALVAESTPALPEQREDKAP